MVAQKTIQKNGTRSCVSRNYTFTSWPFRNDFAEPNVDNDR